MEKRGLDRKAKRTLKKKKVGETSLLNSETPCRPTSVALAEGRAQRSLGQNRDPETILTEAEAQFCGGRTAFPAGGRAATGHRQAEEMSLDLNLLEKPSQSGSWTSM